MGSWALNAAITVASGMAHGNTIQIKAPDAMEAKVTEIVGFYWNQNDNSDDGTTAPIDDASTAGINESLALSGVSANIGDATIDERYVSRNAPSAMAVVDDPSTTNVNEATLYSAYAAAVARSVSDHLKIAGQPAPNLTWIDTDTGTTGIQGANVSSLQQILEQLETFVKNNSVAAVAGEFMIDGDVASTYIWIDSNGNGQATGRMWDWDDDLKKQVVDMDPGDLYLKLVGVDTIEENANHHLFSSGVSSGAAI
ncbi:MAG: hypothetical protein FD149_820 [Rhodospirillaceae bacterium]|nr:MAG: hypothetical protein FD149_820 [Rhodospirillaceae bacterium]